MKFKLRRCVWEITLACCFSCKYCGSRLRRLINKNNTVTWICDGLSRQGKSFCIGIRVPDEKLKPLSDLSGNFYIGKETVNGTESYGYSRKPDQRL